MQSYLPLLMGIVASASSGKTGEYASVSSQVHPDPSKKQSNSGVESMQCFFFFKLLLYIYVGFTNFLEPFWCNAKKCAPEINYLYIVAIKCDHGALKSCISCPELGPCSVREVRTCYNILCAQQLFVE